MNLVVPISTVTIRGFYPHFGRSIDPVTRFVSLVLGSGMTPRNLRRSPLSPPEKESTGSLPWVIPRLDRHDDNDDKRICTGCFPGTNELDGQGTIDP